MAAHAAGDLPRAADYLDRAEKMLRQSGHLGLLSQVRGWQAPASLALGTWQRQAAASAEGHQLAARSSQPIWATQALLIEGVGLALRGQATEALQLADDAELAASGRRLSALLSRVRLLRGCAWITLGRHDDAFAELSLALDPADPSYHPREQFACVMFLAEAAAHCGQREAARAVLEPLHQIAGGSPVPALHVFLGYARAVLADDAHAEDLYQEVLGQDLSRWPWPKARAELAYGRWLRRQRQVTRARVPLRSALAAFRLMGARTWAEQARSELLATGEQVPEPGTFPAQEALSAQELRIARLAARGLSNREIGQRLGLSPRTVGSHLYRVFPKLGITSRAQLAAHFGEAARR